MNSQLFSLALMSIAVFTGCSAEISAQHEANLNNSSKYHLNQKENLQTNKVDQINDAIQKQDYKKLKQFWQKGYPFGGKSSQGTTPLITAIKKLDAITVSYLIENGADINERDSEGKTPFYHSVMSKNFFISCRLVVEEIDETNVDGKGTNAQELLISQGYPKAAKGTKLYLLYNLLYVTTRERVILEDVIKKAVAAQRNVDANRLENSLFKPKPYRSDVSEYDALIAGAASSSRTESFYGNILTSKYVSHPSGHFPSEKSFILGWNPAIHGNPQNNRPRNSIGNPPVNKSSTLPQQFRNDPLPTIIGPANLVVDKNLSFLRHALGPENKIYKEELGAWSELKLPIEKYQRDYRQLMRLIRSQ